MKNLPSHKELLEREGGFEIKMLGGVCDEDGGLTGSAILILVHEVGKRALTILHDCGLQIEDTPKARVLNSFLPIEVSNLDYAFISHGHIDHFGNLPYWLRHMPTKTKLIMTHTTYQIVRIMLEHQVEQLENTKKYRCEKLARRLKSIQTIASAHACLKHGEHFHGDIPQRRSGIELVQKIGELDRIRRELVSHNVRFKERESSIPSVSAMKRRGKGGVESKIGNLISRYEIIRKELLGNEIYTNSLDAIFSFRRGRHESLHDLEIYLRGLGCTEERGFFHTDGLQKDEEEAIKGIDDTIRETRVCLARLRAQSTCYEPGNPINLFADGENRAQAQLYKSGHIIGSSSTEIICNTPNGRFSAFFTLDVGRDNDRNPLSDPCQYPKCSVDVVAMEGTYGDREHPESRSSQRRFCHKINQTLKRKGKILLPVLAVERSFHVMMAIIDLIESGKIEHPQVPCLIDGPLLWKLLPVYEEANPQYKRIRESGIFQSVQDYMQQHGNGQTDPMKLPGSAIIVATGGMLPDRCAAMNHMGKLGSRDSVILTSYQPEEGLGRRLLNQREVAINGRLVPNFPRNHGAVGHFSTHAAQQELVGKLTDPDKIKVRRHGLIVLMHGSIQALTSLKTALLSTNLPKKIITILKGKRFRPGNEQHIIYYAFSRNKRPPKKKTNGTTTTPLTHAVCEGSDIE